MFDKRNNTLIGPIEKIMKENALRYAVEKLVNEDFKIHSKKALPHESVAAYDMVLEGSIQKSLTEGVAQIDEVSKARATEYLEKSKKSWSDARDKWDDPKGRTKKTNDELGKRSAGIDDAKAKLSGKAKVNANEETESLEEVSRDRLKSYVDKAKTDRIRLNGEAGHAADHGKKYKGTQFGKDRDSESDEYQKKNVSRTNGIYKAKDKLNHKAKVNSVREETESLEEISKGRLGAYIKRATDKVDAHGGARSALAIQASKQDDKQDREILKKFSTGHDDKVQKRKAGISKAVDKLVKEETLVEKIMSNIKKNLDENWDKGQSSSYVSDKVAANKHLATAKSLQKEGDKVGYHKAMAKFEKAGYHGAHPMAQPNMASAKAMVKKHLAAAKEALGESVDPTDVKKKSLKTL